MSTNLEARAWIRVRADALRRNLARVRGSAGPQVGVIPMVKADAYGLGMREVVGVLRAEAPWGWGVATVEESRELRALGVDEPIVVFCPVLPDDLDAALATSVQLCLSSSSSLHEVARAGRRVGVVPEVHIDVDTGMGRTGFDWASAEAWMPLVEEAAAGGDIRWVGCFTHLHSADESDDSIHLQLGRFTEALEACGALPEGLLIHALNSAGAFGAPELAASAVRPGIFLFGGAIGADHPVPEPVVSLHARVIHVREAAAGATVGYGATHAASGAERWATLSVGYGDGLPRALGNRGSALLRARRAPIIGRISMDMTVVDISEVPEVEVGDVATLVGTEGLETITIDDVAEQAGTVSYEVLTGLTTRLPRVWTGLEPR